MAGFRVRETVVASVGDEQLHAEIGRARPCRARRTEFRIRGEHLDGRHRGPRRIHLPPTRRSNPARRHPHWTRAPGVALRSAPGRWSDRTPRWWERWTGLASTRRPDRSRRPRSGSRRRAGRGGPLAEAARSVHSGNARARVPVTGDDGGRGSGAGRTGTGVGAAQRGRPGVRRAHARCDRFGGGALAPGQIDLRPDGDGRGALERQREMPDGRCARWRVGSTTWMVFTGPPAPAPVMASPPKT